MGKVLSFFDGLTNALTGGGTRRDPRAYSQYAISAPMTQVEVAAAYSGSGLMRKIVQIPPLDMVREWRNWKLKADQITLIENEEKRLKICMKVREVEVLRALGGGALILGLPGDPTTPAPAPSRNSLAFVHVVSRWHLSFDQLEDNALSPLYGEPREWRLNTGTGQQFIHPSRVIPFRADYAAMSILQSASGADAFWGESVVKQVLDAVQDCDTARASFAALMHKARLLRIGIPNLLDIASTQGGEGMVMKRLAVLASAESLHNATIFDAGDPETGKGGEQINDATYSFAGAKDILNSYAEFVSAISDIPATRLLGRAPEGMNASGDSQQADWNKKIRARQTLELAPCLDRLDPYLVGSALGSTPDGAWYDWAPLDTPTEKEIAETLNVYAQGIERLVNSGLVPDEAMARGVQSRLVIDGYFPELEMALAEMPEDERWGLRVEEGALEEEGGDPANRQSAGGGVNPPARRATNDATPCPLYVNRRLLNAGDLIAWAKANGFTSTIPAEDMHVTVLYSRKAVDPLKLGETWSSEDDGGLVINAGGPRALERFNEGAVVLQFASWALQSRHEQMIREGASHDWPEYLPHITITYEAPADMDVGSIKPFTGALEFGPEEFEPLDLDWKSKIEEA